MSKMSKRDVQQIQKFEHDEESNAKKVKMIDTEISIELDHTDGDSVTAHAPLLSASVTGVTTSDSGTDVIPPLNCQTIKKVMVHCTENVNPLDVVVMASPVDTGDVWYEVGYNDIIHDICARRVKVQYNGNVDCDIHLVGQG